MQRLVVELIVDCQTDDAEQMVADIVTQVQRVPDVSYATGTLASTEEMGEEATNA